VRRAGLAAALLVATLTAGCAAGGASRWGAASPADPALEAELASAAAPADGPRYIFLGVALSDASPAFHGDVTLLDRLLEHQYGKAYRRVLLSNGGADDEARDLPLATAANVDAAVRRLQELRRPDDRFIVLFTAHGGKGFLAAELHGRRRKDVESATLGRWVHALAPNRTWVLVSSCYAGSHLAAMAGPQVMAMTAADADHMAFGCGTLNRNTYFVSALARSLDSGKTVQAIWDAAGDRLRGWEAWLKAPDAKPQVRVGEGLGDLMGAKLSTF
jgi:hypothetical protein